MEPKGRLKPYCTRRSASYLALFLLLILGVAELRAASERPMHFSTLDSNAGLSQNTVFAIAQDADGFIWIGTEQGLNRYDGYAIEQLHRDTSAGSGLQDSFVYALEADQEGGLWIATARGGLSYREPETGRVKPWPLELPLQGNARDLGIRALHVSADGALWIGTLGSGVLRLDPDSGSVSALEALVDSPPAGLAAMSAYAFVAGPSGELWIATDQGLFILDPIRSELERLPNDPESGLPGTVVRDLLLNERGDLWVATLDRGLARTSDRGDSWTHWPGLRSTGEVPSGRQPSSSRINALFQDQAGRLWIGTDNGLNLYDADSGSFHYYQHNGASSAIADNGILEIFQDRTGLLWFGTRAGGVSTWHPSGWQLGHERPEWSRDTPVTSFATTSDSTFIGTLGGGIIEQRGSSERRIDTAHGLTDTRVMTLAHDLSERLWIGTMTQGLFSLEPGAERVIPYTPPSAPGSTNPLADAGIMSLLRSPDGNLWVGTYGRGLWQLNPYTRTLIAVGPAAEPLLPDLQILSLTAAGPDRLWVGTNKGLYLIHREDGVLAHFEHDPEDATSISADTVYSTHADANDQLWIGTSDGGLNRVLGSALEPTALRFERYDPKQLNAHSIYGIESDSHGHLWMATNNGLLRLDPADRRQRLFGPADGAQDREYNFGAHHRAADGKLYFGGRNGYNAFSPLDMAGEASVAPIQLLEFEARGERPFDLGGQNTAAEPLNLTYVQNAFTVRFALLDFRNPDANSFSYRLAGFDGDWSAFTTANSATYTNLDPGNYRLEVRARSSSGMPGEDVQGLRVTISPPPWASPVAYGAYTLLLIIAATALIQWLRRRESRLRAYREQLELEVAQRTAELEESNLQLAQATRAKSDFLARMSHEIRTPMNGIFGTAELLLRSPLADRQKQQVNIIHKSCGALIALINDILDFSKIEAGKLKLEAVPFDLMTLVHEVAQLFIHQAQQKSLPLFINASCPTLPVTGDPLRIRQIISNLVGNAIKFTEHGYIELQVRSTGAGVEIAVRDTGIGIRPDAQEEIFKSFSQADGSTSRRFGGTGLGLSICAQLTELMDGRIEITSATGAGSTFTVHLPLPLSPAAPARELATREALVLVSHNRQGEILKETLEQHGIRVAVRSDVESAFLDRALIERIDALICDPLSSIGLDQWLDTAQTNRSRPLRIITLGDCAFDAAPQYSVANLITPAAPADLLNALSTASETSPSKAETALPKIQLEGQLLLVEDNPVNQEVIVGMLELLGIQPAVANDGPSALSLCASNRFQIILLDCGLPEMDGLEVTRRLRAGQGPSREATIIALTANSLSGERDNCLAAGMDDFLAKPCTLIDLARTLAHWIETAQPIELEADDRAPSANDPLTDGPGGTERNTITATHRDTEPRRASRFTEIDLPALQQIHRLERAGRSGMLNLLIKMYQADLQTALSQLAAMIPSEDADAMRSIAHKLKSSSANVGALTYAESWSALEHACTVGEESKIQALLKLLTANSDAVLAALEAAAQNLAESA